jgi:hypothetical protein
MDLERRTLNTWRYFALCLTTTILTGITTGILMMIQSPISAAGVVLLLIAMTCTAGLYITGHQLARAWLKIWGEMGLQ